MPRQKSKSRHKEKLGIKSIKNGNEDPQSKDGDFDPENESDEILINNLGSIASLFPAVIQKILQCLEISEKKFLRLTSKSLKTAVDHYIGLDLILSESRNEVHQRIKIINKEVLKSLKTFGVRCLIGINLTKTKVFELITFPYLLQSIQLVGRVEQHVILGIFKECWNLRAIKFQEPSPFQKLVTGNFLQFIHSVGEYVKQKESIRLDKLKCLQIYCATTSTMGFMLVLLSVLEARNLHELQFCMGPIHANFYPLISGLIVRLINQAEKTLKSFTIIVESGDAYPELTAKRRLLRKLNSVEDFPDILPFFSETLEKLFLTQEERDEWLQESLNDAGMKTNLETLRIDIDTLEDFTNNWMHFAKHQSSLKVLEVQTCCCWTTVENLIKQNSTTLEKLSLVMEFRSVMNFEDLFQNCSKLKFLTLKNYDLEDMGGLAEEMRLNGNIINAQFDQILPNLEGLVLSDLLIRVNDIKTIGNLKHLQSFMFSLVDITANDERRDPNNMFGLLYEDFQTLLHMRDLNYLILSQEALVCFGDEEKRLKDELEMDELLADPLFHAATIFDWQSHLEIDDDHVVVAHGEKISMNHWFFPFLMSVVDDTEISDILWTRSLMNT